MPFIDRLNILMKKNGITTKAELSKISGIPYTTIDGFYKKGSDNIKLSTLKKLSECLNCSLDYLVDDEPEEPQVIAAHFDGDEYTEAELDRIKEFAAFVKASRKPQQELYAAHSRSGASEEDIQHDYDIMDNKNF